MALWIPSLDAVSLNPDESQYEATASYLVAHGHSAFLPDGAPGIFLLFKAMTWITGAYPMFGMRVLVQLAALAIALLLYRDIGRATHRLCGLLSGMLFLHLVTRFGGFVVNREWFASLFTVAGLSLYLATGARDGRRRRLLLALAGFLCGMALWFKLQVSFIVFVVPVAMLLDAFGRRTIRGLEKTLPAFALGGIVAGVVYLVPYALQGTLSQFLGFVFSDVGIFVQGNEQAIRSATGDVITLYLDRYYYGLPYRPLFFVAYVFAGAVLIANLTRREETGTRSSDWLRRRSVTLFAVYLPPAMIAIQLGNRFFDHYYQLMLPAVAACTGLAVYGFAQCLRDRPAWRVVAIVVTTLFLLDRFVALQREPLWFGEVHWPNAVLVGVLAVGCLAVAAFWLQRPIRRAGAALAGLLVVQTGVLVGAEQLAPAPVSMHHNQYKFIELTAFLNQRAEPGDRLFVWGWAPEVYSLARLEAASHITFCQFVANDLKGVPDRPRLNEEWADLLMRELRETRPRFIVDAATRSWFETERTIYDLDNFPEFELNALLRESYREVARVDDCPVWERVHELVPNER